VVSWSAIDYLGNWKALHYQTKRSFENIAVFAFEKDSLLNFYAVNDSVEDLGKISLDYKLLKFDGESLGSGGLVDKEEFKDGILKFYPALIDDILDKESRNDVFLHLVIKDEKSKVLAESNFFFAKPKDLFLPKPNINIKKISPTEIEVSTDVLAKDVYLMGETHFSDNFFDLLPGEKKKIQLSKALEKIDVMSLWDTMQ
jgi:beta-mannosidase